MSCTNDWNAVHHGHRTATITDITVGPTIDFNVRHKIKPKNLTITAQTNSVYLLYPYLYLYYFNNVSYKLYCNNTGYVFSEILKSAKLNVNVWVKSITTLPSNIAVDRSFCLRCLYLLTIIAYYYKRNRSCGNRCHGRSQLTDVICFKSYTHLITTLNYCIYYDRLNTCIIVHKKNNNIIKGVPLPYRLYGNVSFSHFYEMLTINQVHFRTINETTILNSCSDLTDSDTYIIYILYCSSLL